MGSGDDTIKSGKGDGISYGDVQSGGGSGDDKINAGQGDDTLTGNGGADKFQCGKGEDTITDYNPEEGDKASCVYVRFRPIYLGWVFSKLPLFAIYLMFLNYDFFH